MGLPKKLRLGDSYPDIKEIIKMGASQFMSLDQYNKSGIIIEDNDENEIKDFISDILKIEKIRYSKYNLGNEINRYAVLRFDRYFSNRCKNIEHE